MLEKFQILERLHIQNENSKQVCKKTYLYYEKITFEFELSFTSYFENRNKVISFSRTKTNAIR